MHDLKPVYFSSLISPLTEAQEWYSTKNFFQKVYLILLTEILKILRQKIIVIIKINLKKNSEAKETLTSFSSTYYLEQG